jgi:translation initiation factor 2 alpha subunit (eIF-2alpha)
MSAYRPHRFYPEEYPSQGDVVIVTVIRVEEMGVICTLDEYAEKECIIPLQEVSRVKMRNISQVMHAGKQETVVVLRVDPSKGLQFFFHIPLTLLYLVLEATLICRNEI